MCSLLLVCSLVAVTGLGAFAAGCGSSGSSSSATTATTPAARLGEPPSESAGHVTCASSFHFTTAKSRVVYLQATKQTCSQAKVVAGAFLNSGAAPAGSTCTAPAAVPGTDTYQGTCRTGTASLVYRYQPK